MTQTSPGCGLGFGILGFPLVNFLAGSEQKIVGQLHLFLFSRQLSLLGSYMGTKSELHTVMKLVAAGRLKPVVDRVFPLAEAAAAHAYLESSSQFGKVVLRV